MNWALGLAAVAALATSAAHGESYHVVGQKPYGTLVVDGATVEATAIGRRAWTTLFLAKDSDGSGLTRGVAFMMTLDEYDCAAGRSRHLNLQTYNSRGDPIEETQGAQPWEFIVPSSNAAVEGQLICDDEFRRRDPEMKSSPIEMLRAVRTSSKAN